MLKADGFDKAVIGRALNPVNREDVIVYDAYLCMKILVERDGMTEDEAIEYLEFNTIGAFVGESTPIFVWRMSLEEVEASI
tara:strand:+ start:646 stop:888 length:243 start_codon:yes stop_codon:yes gene_type:complete